MKDAGDVSFVYSQLTMTNYTTWVIKVEAFREVYGVWDVVEPDNSLTSNISKSTDKRRNITQYQKIKEIITTISLHKQHKS